MKFFKPNEKFLPAIKKLVPRASIVIDCGCGEGQVCDLLNKNKIFCIGLELYPQDTKSNYIIGINAEDYKWNDKSIPLICRPCAGEWYFNIIDTSLKNGSNYALYVGVKKNYDRDIKRLKKKYTVVIVEKYVGEDEETLYLIAKKETEVEKLHNNQNTEDELNFCLIQTKYWDHPSWMEDRGDSYWHNRVGGRTPKSKDDVVLKTVRGAIDFEDLDWSECGLLVDTKESGWLSPNGDFYGCNYMGHDTIAHLILKQKPDVLMNFGWVRVHSPKDWCCYKELTPNQQFFMNQNNYDMKYHYGTGDDDE